MARREASSLAESLASLPETDRLKVIDDLSDEECAAFLHDWRFWARPKQLAPEGGWGTWVIRAGRGFGKTRSGTGWVHERATEEANRWIALVAKTPADARDYMIEGPGGILRNTPPWEKPSYEPSKRRLTWKNGSWATIYSSEEPDQLRGFSGDTAWLDEFAKYPNPREIWENLMFGMREASADRPRVLLTTTPRPVMVLKEIEARPSTVVVVGSSYENRRNLAPEWYTEVIEPLRGTRLGRQEIEAEILDDVPGALWTRKLIEDARRPVGTEPDMVRIVVAIDPAVTSGEQADETGIVAVGKGVDGRAYVLADRSCRLSPDGWARRAVDLLKSLSGDRIIGETNNGGEMVELTLRTVDPGVPFKAVHASRGKRTRAEPIAALYEQGRVSHVGTFPELEDQQCAFVPDLRDGPDDRVDALVYALTETMLDHRPVLIGVVGGGK